MSTPEHAPTPLFNEHAPVLITSAREDAPVRMVDLFHLDGKAYQIPAEPRFDFALQLLKDTEEHGDSMANLMLLRKLLGDEGYEALAHFKGLKREQFREVAQAASRITLGALEDTSGN